MAKNKTLLHDLGALGFPLFEPQTAHDVNALLADVVKSGDLRLWEGFPVVAANAADQGLFDFGNVIKRLGKPSDKKYLQALVLMSLALYRVSGLSFAWADKFYKHLPPGRKRELSGFVDKLRKDEDLKVLDHVMSSQRLKNVFGSYLAKTQSKLNELISMKEELSLEYALSQVFSSKQRDLFLKRLKGEKLTKTEREYFSRVVKKKVLALANAELHRLAQRLLQCA